MNKQYIKVVISSCVSRFGDSIDGIAYGWMVYLMTGSPTVLATLFAVNGIPSFLFNFFVGPIVNRLNKKKILILSSVSRACIVMFTVTLYSFNLLQVWHLYALTFLTSAFEAFSGPAATAFTTMILDEEEYDKTIGLSRGIITVSEFIGIATAGVILGIIGVKFAMIINAASFFISAFCISLVKYKERISTKAGPINYKEDFMQGLKYLFSNSSIAFVLFFGTSINFFLVPLSSQAPAYVKDVLCRDANYVSIMFGSIFFGLFIGSTFTSKLRQILNVKAMALILGSGTFLAYIGYSVAPKVTAVIPQIILLVVCGLMFGIPNTMMSVKTTTYFLKNCDKERLTTCSGVGNAFSLCAAPLGGAVSGALLVKVSIPAVFTIFGFALLLVTILQLFIKLKNTSEEVTTTEAIPENSF